jgi:DNA mismatch repair protein MutS2
MDTHTLDLLEFDKIRAIVASYAACSLGKERARQLEPLVDLGEIRNRQALTTEMVEALRSGLTPPLGGVHDIRAEVRRAQVGAALVAEELAQVAEVLRAIGQVNRWMSRITEQFPRLGALEQSIGEFSGVAGAIETCLDNRGKILDTASRRLSAIRREIRQAEERIQSTLRLMLRTAEIKRILRYPNFTMVGHHYVLPIAKEHRGAIQGSVHRTSASNETVYVEPQAIADQSAQLAFLRAREAKEIRRVLRWLSAQVGQVSESLLGTLETLADIDLIHAQGRLSIDYQMTPPDFNEDGQVVLREARHPLLEYLFRAEERARHEPRPVTDVGEQITEPAPGPTQNPPEPKFVVPIDVHLGLRFSILVVTGPNTGGKTVALKTVGLLAVMGQAGLHIPASQGSRLPVFDQVLADIGDEQSLEQSLSTFSSHIRRISEIVRTATQRSLVLLDELGAGTDPDEGASLGRSILDELDSIGCLAIVTTHIGDLKTYALSNPRAENAAVEFDIETLRPLFRLRIGDIGQSNALAIARRLNLPEHLVARASTYLERGRGSHVPELEALQTLRKEAEEARQAAIELQAQAQRSRDAINQRLTDLQQQAEHDARLADARAHLKPGDRVVVPRFGYDRPGRIVRIDPRRKTAVVSIGHVQWNVTVDELVPQGVSGPQSGPSEAQSASPARSGPGVPDIDSFADHEQP